MQNEEYLGKLKVVDIIDDPNGSAKVTFEADDKFKKWFKEKHNLKKWSQKRFNKFLQDVIDRMTVQLKEEQNATTEKKQETKL